MSTGTAREVTFGIGLNAQGVKEGRDVAVQALNDTGTAAEQNAAKVERASTRMGAALAPAANNMRQSARDFDTAITAATASALSKLEKMRDDFERQSGLIGATVRDSMLKPKLAADAASENATAYKAAWDEAMAGFSEHTKAQLGKLGVSEGAFGVGGFDPGEALKTARRNAAKIGQGSAEARDLARAIREAAEAADHAYPLLDRMSDAQARLEQGGKKAKFSLGDLVPAFNGLAARAVGMESVFGTLAGTIGSIFSAGATGVLLAGAAVIGLAWSTIADEANKAKEKMKDAHDQLTQMRNDALSEPVRIRILVDLEQKNLKEVNDKLHSDSWWRQALGIDAQSGGRPMNSVLPIVPYIGQNGLEFADPLASAQNYFARKRRSDLIKQRSDIERNLDDGGESARKAQKAQDDDAEGKRVGVLAKEVGDREASRAEMAKAREEIARYTKALKDLRAEEANPTTTGKRKNEIATERERISGLRDDLTQAFKKTAQEDKAKADQRKAEADRLAREAAAENERVQKYHDAQRAQQLKTGAMYDAAFNPMLDGQLAQAIRAQAQRRYDPLYFGDATVLRQQIALGGDEAVGAQLRAPQLTSLAKAAGDATETREFTDSLGAGFQGALEHGLAEGFASAAPVGDAFWSQFAAAGEQALTRLITQQLTDALSAKFGKQFTQLTEKLTTGKTGAAVAGGLIGYTVGYQTRSATAGALGGAAGGAAAGYEMAGPWGAVIGGAVGAIGGLIGAHKGAKEAAERMAKAQDAYTASFAGAQRQLLGIGTPLDDLLDNIHKQTETLRDQAKEAYKGDKYDAERFDQLNQIDTLEAQAKAKARQDAAQQRADFVESLSVRQMQAAGAPSRDTEDRKQALADQQELTAAVKEYGEGIRDLVLATQAAEKAERELTRARADNDTRNDLDASIRDRTTSIFGSDRDKVVAQAEKDAQAFFKPFVDAYNAGIITAEKLKEAQDAANAGQQQQIANYDAQVAATTKASITDARVRELTAQGKTREAEDLRIAADNESRLAAARKLGADALLAEMNAEDAEAKQREENRKRQREDAQTSIGSRIAQLKAQADGSPEAQARYTLLQAELANAKELRDAKDALANGDIDQAQYDELADLLKKTLPDAAKTAADAIRAAAFSLSSTRASLFSQGSDLLGDGSLGLSSDDVFGGQLGIANANPLLASIIGDAKTPAEVQDRIRKWVKDHITSPGALTGLSQEDVTNLGTTFGGLSTLYTAAGNAIPKAPALPGNNPNGTDNLGTTNFVGATQAEVHENTGLLRAIRENTARTADATEQAVGKRDVLREVIRVEVAAASGTASSVDTAQLVDLIDRAIARTAAGKQWAAGTVAGS